MFANRRVVDVRGDGIGQRPFPFDHDSDQVLPLNREGQPQIDRTSKRILSPCDSLPAFQSRMKPRRGWIN
jgi:hypothetical protein